MAHPSLLSCCALFLLIVAPDSGQSSGLCVILGDPVVFANCSTGRLQKAHDRLVAERAGGVCAPSGDYKDRVDPSGCFAFKRSVHTDTGVYELTCGGPEQVTIQLDVVVALNASVSEGEPVKLECHIAPRPSMEVIQWERNWTTVLRYNLSTEETEYGTGFEGRVRLPPDFHAHGDWTLMWDRALLEDQGDYFCSVYNRGKRMEGGHPAAWRLKVRSDQTSPWIIIGICLGVGLCVACLLVWYLKSRRR